MIKRDEVLTMSDGKDYFVIGSVMYENNNYIMIGEIDNNIDEVVGNIEIMFNDIKNGVINKVTDPKLLLILSTIFGEQEGAFDL